MRYSKIAFLSLIIMLLTAGAAHAQLNSLYLKGKSGLDSGSQAAPGAYWGTLFYWYDTSRINDQFGKQVNSGGKLNLFAGLPMVNIVTKEKLLGGSYGFLLIPAVGMSSSLDAPRFNQNSGAGFGDIYIQPINLGWHFKHADVISGFAFYAPTGRYTAGNPNGTNTGLGMWGFEPSVGTTVHLNEAKTWNASALASFEFNTNKRDTSQHVGDALTLEGGLGRSFLKGAAKLGAAYYAQLKLSNDILTGFPALLVQGKNSVAAVGPELTLPLASKSTLFGFFTFRYEWEVYARTTTQGNTMVIQAVFPFKPVNLKPLPPANRAPTASCSAAANSVFAGSGDTMAIRAEATDPDNDPLTYNWTASSGNIDGSGPAVRWGSEGLGVGNYRVTLNVNDGKGGTASCDVEIRVEPKPNRPPTIACSANPGSVYAGERSRITCNAGDPDGDPLTYTWLANVGQIAATGPSADYDTTGLSPGAYSIITRVDDGRGGVADATTGVEVKAVPPAPMASKVSECAFNTPLSARIDNVCKRILDDVALRLQNEPRATAVIIGYSDLKERNGGKVAGDRGTNAVKYLGEKGIDASRTTTRTGCGQAGADQQNRRIDVIWVPEGATY